MQAYIYKPRSKPQKNKARTLCTIDTFDPNCSESYGRKGKENQMKLRNNPFHYTQPKSTTNKKSSSQHHKSQFSAYAQSRVKDVSQGYGPRGKRAMSISQYSAKRVRTQYAQFQPNATRNTNTAVSLKKRLVFAAESGYRLQCWQIIKKIFQSQQQEIIQKNIIIRTKNGIKKRQYQKEIKIIGQILPQMKGKERFGFLKMKKTNKEGKEWSVLTDNYYHANWQNDQFYLFLNGFKSSLQDLKSLVKHIVLNLEILSKYGYSHGSLGLESINFPIGKNSLKFTDKLKLGNFSNIVQINCKQSFLSMPSLLRTPPQIINLIMFQFHQNFDRDYLDVLPLLQYGWQIDIWALGILILQLLNGGTLSGEGENNSNLLSQQKQLPIRYSYLINQLQPTFQSILLKMLQIHPSLRPHPRQILKIFSI